MTDRPVRVDFTVQEARSVCAALDLAAHILDCEDFNKPEAVDGSDLHMLRERVFQGAVCAELEKQLGL